MAKSIEARLLALEASIEQRRAARPLYTMEEWFQAVQSDDLSYTQWMRAHGYPENVIATILDRRRQARETLGDDEEEPSGASA